MEQGVNTMTELFTSIGGAVTGLLDIVTDVVAWGVQEPIILIGLGASVAGMAFRLFRKGKKSVK